MRTLLVALLVAASFAAGWASRAAAETSDRQPGQLLPGRSLGWADGRAEPTPPARTAPPVSRDEERRPLRQSLGRLTVTAYCWTGSRTASGAWPELGMAAGNRWPFGTRLRVAHVGIVTITDRIGWGSDVDVYYGRGPDCERRALIFGRRQLRVEVAR